MYVNNLNSFLGAGKYVSRGDNTLRGATSFVARRDNCFWAVVVVVVQDFVDDGDDFRGGGLVVDLALPIIEGRGTYL